MDASVNFTVICFSIFKDSPESLAMKHQMDVSSLSRRECCSINPYPAHYRQALAFSILLCPHPHRLPLRVAFPDWPGGEVRGCHVPQKYPDRLGAAFTPKARHLRQRSVKSLYLAIYLLVQAFQHLWLVLINDAYGDLPMFTIRSNLSALPLWCWQS